MPLILTAILNLAEDREAQIARLVSWGMAAHSFTRVALGASTGG